MKHFLLFSFILLVVAIPARAQETEEEELQLVESKFIIPVSYIQIRQQTEDPALYAGLVSQFEAADEDLGLYNISLIYYGWVFKPGYKGNLDVEQSPAEKLMKEGNFGQAWDQGMAYLKENPVSLVTLQHLISAGNAMGKPAEEVRRLTWRFNKLLQMIFHTGDGYTEQSAYKVISITDEFIFMDRMIGVESHAGRAISRTSVDRYDIVNARNFDRRYLFIDASLATHFGPQWEPEEIPEEQQ